MVVAVAAKGRLHHHSDAASCLMTWRQDKSELFDSKEILLGHILYVCAHLRDREKNSGSTSGTDYDWHCFTAPRAAKLQSEQMA